MGTRSFTVYAIRRKSDGKFNLVFGPHGEDTWVNTPPFHQAQVEKWEAEKMAASLQLHGTELKNDVEVCDLKVEWEERSDASPYCKLFNCGTLKCLATERDKCKYDKECKIEE